MVFSVTSLGWALCPWYSWSEQKCQGWERMILEMEKVMSEHGRQLFGEEKEGGKNKEC